MKLSPFAPKFVTFSTVGKNHEGQDVDVEITMRLEHLMLIQDFSAPPDENGVPVTTYSVNSVHEPRLGWQVPAREFWRLKHLSRTHSVCE
jgi:hypothetical protein